MDYTRILYSEISFKPAVNLAKNNGDSIANLANGIGNNLINNNNRNNNNSLVEEFQTPRHQLCDPNVVQLDWIQSERVGGGLVNVGNTCFLNSVLQCLTYCPPLYNYLVKYNGGHSSTCKISQFCMLCEMEKHVKRIKSSNGTSIKPTSIVQRLKYINKSFQFGRQEDAHEFLRYIIDHMWKACLTNHDITKAIKLDPKIKETTVINHIFGGYHRSQVLCLSCNSRSNTFDFFMDFILDIRNAKSLEEALKKFTQPETLENENAYKCGKCRKKVIARKKFTVFKAPNVATFQLKRFDSDRIFGGKVTKFISYPEELDLRPYMSDSSNSQIKYHLSAVLVHVGHSSNSGHYFCFIKNSNNFWYRMDDSSVSLVNLTTVLQQQAYVLFYNRRTSEIPKDTTKPPQIAQDSNQQSHKQQRQEQQSSSQQPLQNQRQPFVLHTKRISDQKHPTNGKFQDLTIPSTANNNNNNITTNSSFTTWLGARSQLDEVDSDKRKLNELNERDKFNQELDRGKIKKIKSRNREDRLSNLAKTNPFQRFTSNGYRQYINKRDSFQKHYKQHYKHHKQHYKHYK